MKLSVLLGVVALFGLLHLVRAKALAWAAAWWLGSAVIVYYGFKVPVPWSVVQLFMAIVTGAIVIYVTSDAQRWADVRDPLVAFMTQRRYQTPLLAVLILAPIAAGWGVFRNVTRAPMPPGFGRTVHPAPPPSINVHDQPFSLERQENPLRELRQSDPEAFQAQLQRGRELYFQNCFYCHGDAMYGDGMFAHGLLPIPTDFQDSGTIAQLQSAYLFWRVAKGAPGLPEEGGPWESSMPAWEQFLSTDEMWAVVLYLYEFTGHEPRALGTIH